MTPSQAGGSQEKPTSPRALDELWTAIMWTFAGHDALGSNSRLRDLYLKARREAAAATPSAALRVEYNTGRRHGYEEGFRAAATPSLDVERARRAFENHDMEHQGFGGLHPESCDEWVAAEYARLDQGSKDSGRPNEVAASATSDSLDEYDSMADYEEHMAALGDPDLEHRSATPDKERQAE